MGELLNKKIQDLENELKWYRDTYEKRRLIGIIKDRIQNNLKKFLSVSFFKNEIKKKKRQIFRDRAVENISSNFLNPAIENKPQESPSADPFVASNEVEKAPPAPEISGNKKFEEVIVNFPKNRQEKGISFKQIKHFFQKRNDQPFKNETIKKPVDIIVPIYNGLHFLEILVPQILKNSDLPYQLILINDCSPDKGIVPFLSKYESEKNITVINNEKNLGFTGSVNKALNLCKNDVVILNTDTEVPPNWLSRLFYPIFTDARVGSVTPFSNCATIASFPKYDDNEIFENLSTDRLDGIFEKSIHPISIEIPTGVGFCMAMSRAALNNVGVLDEENFPKGYGEEVDWCRRIKKSGFKNVHLPNLFIYHKHGGSFSEEAKKTLSRDHQLRLEKLHPDFMPDVRHFFEYSIQNSVRQFLLLQTISNIALKNIVYLDHELGGGANAYTENFITDNKDENLVICVTYIHPLHNPQKRYAIRFYYKEYSNVFTVESLDDLVNFFDYIKIDDLIIGSLITHENLGDVMKAIKRITKKQTCHTSYLIHDYHSICPQFTLMYQGNTFCNIPDYNKCSTCNIKENVHPVLLNKDYTTLKEYRKVWEEFLSTTVQTITCFSISVKRLLLKTYPLMEEKKINVIPHAVKEYRPINIAVIGNIHSRHKGGEIVLEMAKILEREGNPNNARIIVLGELGHEFNHHGIQKSGAYQRHNLYDLIRQNYIDVILIPSICPETFSYTTAEAIISDLPVFSFDLGGQADQVRNFEKGHIIDEMTAEKTLETIAKYMQEKRKKNIK